MKPKNAKSMCIICNPTTGREGEFCERHDEELHRLEHQYGHMFRMQRDSRGKDHESYNIFLESECGPCGRVFLQETDPNSLAITVLLSEEVKLDTPLPEYEALGIRRTWGDLLRSRIAIELVESWYGRARACIEVYPAKLDALIHWDVEAPEDDLMNEDDIDPHSHGGGRHSVH